MKPSDVVRVAFASRATDAEVRAYEKSQEHGLPVREFVEGISCDHAWGGDFVDSTMCSKCFARIKRDKKGRIVDYDVTHKAKREEVVQ